MLYGKHITTESGTYSIDKLIVEIWFPFKTITKEILAGTFENVGLQSYIQQFGPGSFEKKKIETVMWLTDRYRYVMPESETSVVIELLERAVVDRLRETIKDDDGNIEKGKLIKMNLGPQFGVRIQFNPNKHMEHPIIQRFFRWYKEIGDVDYQTWYLNKGERCKGPMFPYAPKWRWRRVDFAFDVLLKKKVCLLSRKREAYQYHTRYYGERGKNGHTRVYDKVVEYNRHIFHKKEPLTKPLTRIEWEQHNEQDITFDVPLLFGDIPDKLRWLRFIKLGELNGCLNTLDKRTKKKIKDNCFLPIPFNPENFGRLLKEYQEEFGLKDGRHHKTGRETDIATPEQLEQWRTEYWQDVQQVTGFDGVGLEREKDAAEQQTENLYELLETLGGGLPETDTEDLEREFYNNSPIKVNGKYIS